MQPSTKEHKLKKKQQQTQQQGCTETDGAKKANRYNPMSARKHEKQPEKYGASSLQGPLAVAVESIELRGPIERETVGVSIAL